ncbi:MAG: cytochrome c [Pseudomonadota bacterium]|nr:cytochrome c [Pseudomonadota bacterium]
MRSTKFAASLALALPLAVIGFKAIGSDNNQAPPSPTPAAASQPTDLDGATLTYTCRGCHGIPGYKNAYPSYRVPKLVGQSEVYLKNALTEYKQGKRQHPTMEAQAQSFSDEDIAAIAAYLASLKK